MPLPLNRIRQPSGFSQGLGGFLGHPVHHLNITGALEAALCQGIFKALPQLP